MATINDILFSSEKPEMPRRLPGMIKHLISQLPDYMKPSGANQLFPPAANEMPADL